MKRPFNYGVIDVGSNSIKLSIAHIKHEGFDIIESYRVGLRLLEEGKETVLPQAQRDLIEILKRFKQALERHDSSYRIIATSALRRARNQADVIAHVFEALDMTIEVISGAEEAELVFHAHASQYDIREGQHLIFDIGGGSVELVEVVNGACAKAISMPMGVVVIKHQLEQAGRSPSVDKRSFESWVARMTAHCTSNRTFLKGCTVWMGGGSPNAILALCKALNQGKDSSHLALGKQGVGYLEAEDLKRVLQWVKTQTPEILVNTYGVKQHRVDLILSTLYLMTALMKRFEANMAYISDAGIREGDIARVLNVLNINS